MLGELLAQRRLVTVVGPGGVGKTRLGVAVAWDSAEWFADGAAAVELAGVWDPAAVPAAIATALGVSETAKDGPIEALVGVLEHRELLVLFDNCEHMLAPVSDMISALLTRTARTRVLATSREPFHITGEAVFRLDPLNVSCASPIDPSDALELFVTRATEADHRFVLGADDVSTAADLVQRVDGLPLAIELLAAHTTTLSPVELFERLERQPNLLTRSERHPIGRHQSLRAAIESSDRLLTGVERKVFYRLSIFANSFDLGAAERVCAAVGDLEPADVARAVANLIDKSVVVARFDSNGTRYGLLDTVRRYAAEKLPEDDDVAPLRAAHLKWMLDLVSDALADPTLAKTYRHPDSPSVLELEADNVRAVVEWAIENDPPAALELSTRLSVWWRMAGRLAEARHWLETALAANSSDPSGVTAQALVQLGLVIQDQLDTSGSLTIHAQAIEAAQSSRDDELAVMATVGMAQALRDCGDYAEAASFAERALALARNCGERGGQTRALAALAFIELYQGHLDAARVHAGEAVDLVDDLYPSDGAWEAFASAAIANAFASELDAAEAHAVAALALGEALGSPFKVAWTHSTLGTIAASRGNIDGEIDHAQECLELSVAIGSKRTLANALMCLSQACGLAGHFDVGGTLVGATSSLVRRAGFALPPGFDRFTRLDAYSEAFGGDRRVLTAAYHRGMALPAPAVVDLARSVTATGTDGSAGLTRAVDRLTPRERELIGHVAQGLTDAQIGAHLTISLRTVHSHLDRIRDKTGARRRADLTRLAMTLGRAEFKETPSS